MRWLLGLSLAAAVGLATTGDMAFAQHHHHHGHSYWGGGYGYAPHLDVHRGHLDLHVAPVVQYGGHHHHSYGGYGYGYGSTWLTPAVTQPIYTQPNTVIVNSAPAQPAAPQQLPAPCYGAYAQVPRVAADLAEFANAMCLTMHKRFQNRPGFNLTYRGAYGVLQQAQAIRDLSGNPGNRGEIIRRLPKIDEDMHRVVAETGVWVHEPSGSTADDINTLKRDVDQVGGALHYLMVDAGVAHKDQEIVVAARPAPPDDTLPDPPKPAEDRTLTKPVPQAEPVAPQPKTPPAGPKFGAYSNVPKVAADVAALANRLCLTMHRGFRNREDFDDAYAAAYDVLQQSQKIRDLARDPDNRKELAKRLEKLDDGMHRVFGEVGEWTNDPKEANNKDIDNLKREFGTLGSAVHYLMTDVGVQHQEEEPEGAEPAAPPPKPKAKLLLPAPPSPGKDQ